LCRCTEMTRRREIYTGIIYMSALAAQQRSQVISRSENPPVRSPGCTFPQKSCRPQNIGRCQRCFTVKIKQIKRPDMVTRVHTGLPKQNSLTFPDFSSQSHNIFPDLYRHKFQYGNCTIRTQ